jgi:predicted Zn-dependent protease
MKLNIKPVQPPDLFLLQAAQGWLELGCADEAVKELDQITPVLQAHPDVMQTRWEVYAARKLWEEAVGIARAYSQVLPGSPFGWVQQAYALHELKRTAEAQAVLLPVVDKFPRDWTMRYNLACYTCQLGDLGEAYQWLQKAIMLGGGRKVRHQAMFDPDLEPLWKNLRRPEPPGKKLES